MGANIDYQYYPVGWSGNWENTINEIETVISSLREKAMLSDGFISFNRYKTVSSADYQRSDDPSDKGTIPYCLIEMVNMRVNKTLRIQKVYFTVTDMPTANTPEITAIRSEGTKNDAQSNSVSRTSRNGKIKQSS
nr:MAG TPA_asm: hypothetical protein [Picobirnaviridae sp.]